MRRVRALLLISAFLSLAFVPNAGAEYRAFWVDTFNTNLNSHGDIVTVVNSAKAAKANALFAQVRRRGDSFYIHTLEPMADRTPIQVGFDPLQDLIDTAHAEGIEVHAFVIMSAIWGRAPNLFPPENPNHAFNLHGGFNAPTNTIVPGPNNWLTRTLLPDGTTGITYQGHRFGSDFWFDFGHPDAAAYTANVVRHLVANYAIDGLHLDRIRYPEIGISGQTPGTGTSVGYNPTSIARFNLRYGRTGTPAQNDVLWNQWRRDQVTSIVRRVYLEANELRPNIRVSAALIAFGGGPACPFGQTCVNDKDIWERSATAEAYWRVYQDWRSWTEEGIIDLAMPMAYKAEHTPAQATQFNQWNEWTKNNQYNRGAVMGIGALSNAVEGTLRQVRRAYVPSTRGKSDYGVIMYSMATSNIAVNSNPWSQPPGLNTGLRSFAELASGLTTGKSVNGLTSYEPVIPGVPPIFQNAAAIPVLPWKSAPTLGHLKGIAKRLDGTPIDTGAVLFRNLDTGDTKTSITDGNGFFGGVDLTPGRNAAKVTLGPDTLYTCAAQVIAGRVSTADAKPLTITAPANLRRPMDPQKCSAKDAGLVVSHSCDGFVLSAERSDELDVDAPFGAGVTVVDWTITGPFDALATTHQSIEVFDDQAPTISAPADLRVSADAGACSAAVNVGHASTSDNCTLPANAVKVVRLDGLPVTAPFPNGTTTLEWSVTDAANLTSKATQTVTVIDDQVPAISPPADLVVNTDAGSCSAIVNVGQATGSDNCALPANAIKVVRLDGHPMTAAFPKGTTTLEWSVTDAANLTSKVTRTVTVVDREGPVISNLSVNRDQLWPPLHNMVSVRVNHSTSDACSSVKTSLSVTSNEPIEGTGDGDTSPDWQVVSDREVLLRAERAGGGEGRIYTITLTAVDDDGNASTKSVNVVVPLNQGR